MALSYEIISQFAKVVNNDKKQTGKETTVYGVVISDGNGNKYVKLDGSDQLTPLSEDERPSADSTVAATEVGEKGDLILDNVTVSKSQKLVIEYRYRLRIIQQQLPVIFRPHQCVQMILKISLITSMK